MNKEYYLDMNTMFQEYLSKHIGNLGASSQWSHNIPIDDIVTSLDSLSNDELITLQSELNKRLRNAKLEEL